MFSFAKSVAALLLLSTAVMAGALLACYVACVCVFLHALLYSCAPGAPCLCLHAYMMYGL